MEPIRLPAYAKINLGLRILCRRADGYHDLWTVFQQVSLADELILEPGGDAVEVRCTHPAVSAGGDNLCWRAAEALRNATGCRHGVHITLHKRIPVGAGLGGGSSDAAVVLAALNAIWQTGLSLEELLALGATLGADVPFFLLGGTAVGEGRGERLTRVALPLDYWCVLAIPNVEISTRWAYSAAKFDLTKREKSITFSGRAEELRDCRRWQELLVNDFEEVIFAAYPAIARLKAELSRLGPFYCSLSGSGGAVFGLFARQEQARRARREVAKLARVHLVRPLTSGCQEVAAAVARQMGTAEGSLL